MHTGGRPSSGVKNTGWNMILDAYAAFLTALSVPFFTTNGFAVEIGKVMIDVTVTRSGIITLSAYIGLTTDLRSADQLCSALTSAWSEYRIWPERYSGYYEIEIEQWFPYSTIEVLHEHVTAMADVVEAGYTMGKPTISDFCR